MAGKSTFLANKVLDHVYGGPAYTKPATVYIAAYTAAPSDAGGGTECTGGAYARVAVLNDATNFPAAVGGAKSNGVAIQFPQASVAWGLVTHVAVLDAPTGGNQLGWGPLAVPKQIDALDTFVLAVGDLDLTED